MIFNFSNYRDYMNEYIKRLPKAGFGEARKMAAHLGVSSTYMSHTLAGTKKLTLEHATALARYLGHSRLEADYFFYLVQLERAGTQDLKQYCVLKLDELKGQSLKLVNRVDAKKTFTEQEKSIFYSSPIYAMVHIYCATQDEGRSLSEISQRFELSRARANEIVRFLLESGLCTEESDRFQTTNHGTHLEQGSPYLLKHHTNWRLRAIQAAENLNDDELMYTLNIALSEKDFGRLREEMVGFIKKFLETAYPSASEVLATLNMDWFRIRR